MALSIVQAALSLAQFSPSIAKWLSSSSTEKISDRILEIAKKVTESKTGLDAIEKLRSDKKLVLSFQKSIIDAQKEIELAIIRDQEHARDRDVALIHSGRKNKRADIMVISAACGLILCLAVMIFFQKNLPGEAVGIISTIAGIFGSCLKDAYNFEFGSSRGSKEKDQTVADLLNRHK